MFVCFCKIETNIEDPTPKSGALGSLKSASIGMANNVLSKIDKYVAFAVEKYHGKQKPSKKKKYIKT